MARDVTTSLDTHATGDTMPDIHFKWEMDRSVTESLLNLSDTATEVWDIHGENASIWVEEPDMEPWSWTHVAAKSCATPKDQPRSKKRGSTQTLSPQQGGEVSSSGVSSSDVKGHQSRLDYSKKLHIMNQDNAQLLQSCIEPRTYRYIPNNGTYRAFKISSRLEHFSHRLPRRIVDRRSPLTFEQRKLQREIQKELRKEFEASAIRTNLNVGENDEGNVQRNSGSPNDSLSRSAQEDEYLAKPRTFDLPPITVPLVAGAANHLQHAFSNKEVETELGSKLKPGEKSEHQKALKIGYKRRSRSEPPPVIQEEESRNYGRLGVDTTKLGDTTGQGLSADTGGKIAREKPLASLAWDKTQEEQMGGVCKNIAQGDNRRYLGKDKVNSFDSGNCISQAMADQGSSKARSSTKEVSHKRKNDLDSSVQKEANSSHGGTIKSCKSGQRSMTCSSADMTSSKSGSITKTLSSKLVSQISSIGSTKTNSQNAFSKKTRHGLVAKKLSKDLACTNLSLKGSANACSVIDELKKPSSGKQHSITVSHVKSKEKKELLIQDPEKILPVISGTKICHRIK